METVKAKNINEENLLFCSEIRFPSFSLEGKLKTYSCTLIISQIKEGKPVNIASIEISKKRIGKLESYKIHNLDVFPDFKHKKDETIQRVGSRIMENLNSFLIERSKFLSKRGAQLYGYLLDETEAHDNPPEVVNFYKKHGWKPYFPDVENGLYFFPEQLTDENKELFLRIPD